MSVKVNNPKITNIIFFPSQKNSPFQLMPFDLQRQRKLSKKSCIECHLSPQNILVLACDHSVCLQCAYATLNNRQRDKRSEEMEFGCVKCGQVTYFDKDLVKQIESAIQSHKPKINSSVQFDSFVQKNQRTDSFIQKMKKQYLSQNPPQKQNTTPNTKEPNRTVFIQKNKLKDSRQKRSHRSNKHEAAGQKTPQARHKVQKTKPAITKTPVKSEQNSKCKFHLYYELLYLCVQCSEVVCSECLLRGKHREHNNQTIAQILQHDLPEFINQTFEKLLYQVNKVQTNKDQKYSQLDKKIKEITHIRQNAVQHFMEVRRNIEKEQKEVMQKCDRLLQNLRTEQKEHQQSRNSLETQLAKNIEEIKTLKASYKMYLNDSTHDKRENAQQLLIHKFIQCSMSIGDFFQQKNHSGKMLEEKRQTNASVYGKESQILNKTIQQSIQSIRDSLVFDSFLRPIYINHQKKHRRASQLQTKTQKQPIYNTKTTQQPLFNQYISYITTQNSQSKRKQEKKQSRQRSTSISPYEVQRSPCRYKMNSTQFNRKSIMKQSDDVGKQNVWIQPGQNQFITTKISSEASSQNVSIKKYVKKSKNNSKSRSKNNSIGKKKHSATNTSFITKFKA